MVAVDRDRREVHNQPMLGESLLPVAAVYGPNASGKSNIIAAFSWLLDAVRHSLIMWEDTIPTDPFAFQTDTGGPTNFMIEVTIRGIRFEYELEINSQAVIYEALFHYPEKKRRRVFERAGNDLKVQRGLGGFSGTRELLTERTLALSVARRFDEPLVADFTRDLLLAQTLGLATPRPHIGEFKNYLRPPNLRPIARWFEGRDQPSLFEEVGDERKQALALLRLADLGIEDVVVDTQHITVTGSSETHQRRRVRLVHRIANEQIPFELAAESAGTRTWFSIIGPLLSALRNGSLLLFDELDASLHPTLSAQLIQLFHDPTTNSSGAQLVFTSHDTSLLNHLNRDEVWLTEKRPDGSTRLGALAEFAGERVRKSQNLESAYLHGRFGALPKVDQVEILHALGLIG